jgi:hypothetical protein
MRELANARMGEEPRARARQSLGNARMREFWNARMEARARANPPAGAGQTLSFNPAPGRGTMQPGDKFRT